jgi:hypothetical protein
MVKSLPLNPRGLKSSLSLEEATSNLLAVRAKVAEAERKLRKEIAELSALRDTVARAKRKLQDSEFVRGPSPSAHAQIVLLFARHRRGRPGRARRQHTRPARVSLLPP